MNLNRGRKMRKGVKKRERKKESRPKDSGRVVRLELVREREVISVMVVNRSGKEAAKTLHGTFRATARGDSK